MYRLHKTSSSQKKTKHLLICGKSPGQGNKFLPRTQNALPRIK